MPRSSCHRRIHRAVATRAAGTMFTWKARACASKWLPIHARLARWCLTKARGVRLGRRSPLQYAGSSGARLGVSLRCRPPAIHQRVGPLFAGRWRPASRADRTFRTRGMPKPVSTSSGEFKSLALDIPGQRALQIRSPTPHPEPMLFAPGGARGVLGATVVVVARGHGTWLDREPLACVCVAEWRSRRILTILRQRAIHTCASGVQGRPYRRLRLPMTFRRVCASRLVG